MGDCCAVVFERVFTRRVDLLTSAGIFGCVRGGLLSSYTNTLGVVDAIETGLRLIALSGEEHGFAEECSPRGDEKAGRLLSDGKGVLDAGFGL